MFQDVWSGGLRRKIGLQTAEAEDDVLIQSLLTLMQQDRVDWTSAFRKLSDSVRGDDTPFWSLFEDRAAADQWLSAWRERLSREEKDPKRADRMDRENPIYIPRNHLVEEALAAAIDDNDLAPFEKFCQVLATPYVDQGPDRSRYTQPAQQDGRPYRTFCGT
jgi:serine/tyrosine/threonine adenylyltransferase